MAKHAYLRFPDIRGDSLAFVTDDDIWIGSIERGEAWRLGVTSTKLRAPRLSHDGTTVAWVSDAAGPLEIWVTSVPAGVPRRLTWWGGGPTNLLGWLRDGRLVAASAQGAPDPEDQWAWALPADGGAAERLPWGPVSGLSESSTGQLVLGVDQSMNRGFAWKRYRGGGAGKI